MSIDDEPKTSELPTVDRRSDLAVMAYQLKELTGTVKTFIAKIDAKHENLDRRITKVETWQDREDAIRADQARRAGAINSRWIPVLLGVLTIAASIVIAILGATGHLG